MRHFAVSRGPLILLLVATISMPCNALARRQDTIKSIKGKRSGSVAPATKAWGKNAAPRRTNKKSIAAPLPPRRPDNVVARPQPLPQPRVISTRSMGLMWQLQRGSNICEADENGIHIAHKDAKAPAAYASASAALEAIESSIWKVSFTAYFGSLESIGTRVLLTCSGSTVAEVSGDSQQNGISVFVGGFDRWYARRNDARSHQFEIIGTPSQASIWLDGAKVFDGAVPGKPDRISIGPASQAVGRQTELRVQDLTVQPTESSHGAVELFNGKDLAGWSQVRSPWLVDRGSLKNLGESIPDCIEFVTEIPADAFAVNLRIQILDGRRLRVYITPMPVYGQLAGLYFGSENNGQDILLYGRDVVDAKQLSNAVYQYNEWYDFRLDIDPNDNVTLSRNGQETYRCRLANQKPVRLMICAGDNASVGHVEITSLQITANSAFSK